MRIEPTPQTTSTYAAPEDDVKATAATTSHSPARIESAVHSVRVASGRTTLPAAAVRARQARGSGAPGRRPAAGRRRPGVPGEPAVVRPRSAAGRGDPSVRPLAEADVGRSNRHGTVPLPQRAAGRVRGRSPAVAARPAPGPGGGVVHRRRDVVCPHRGAREQPHRAARGGLRAHRCPTRLPKSTTSPRTT